MFNFVRWYNQNRGKFWLTILIILGVIFFIQVANNFYKRDNKQTNDNTIGLSSNIKNNINNKIDGTLESSKSLIDGSNISSENLEREISVIDSFIKYCNNGQIQQAYDLLTDECKECLFANLESFKSKYHNKVFSTYKTYTIQNWAGNTYKVKLTEDALTTGKVSSTSLHFQEYITIVRDNSKYKLNINNYIGRTKINKTTTDSKITVNVVNKDEYMDYTEYTIKVQNNTGKTILLDNGQKANTMYLLDSNNIKEYVSTGEIIYTTLKLNPSESKPYKFKFPNNYSNTREMKSLVFENVIMDYEKYNETLEKNKYEEFEDIVVNV